MGSVYRRRKKDGSREPHYTISWFDPKLQKPRSQKAFRDKRASEELLRQKEDRAARVSLGMPVAPEGGQARTYAETVDLYLGDLRREGLTEGYLERVEQQLTAIAELDLGPRKPAWSRVADISAEGLTAFLAYLSTRQAHAGPVKVRRGANRNCDRLGAASPRTCNAYRDALSAFCSWCVDQEHLPANPVARVPKASLGRPGDVSKRPHARRALTLAEFDAVIRHPKIREWRRLWYQVAGLSGLRRREMGLFAPCDFTLGTRPRWHLRPEITKGRRLDTVPMLPECASLLADLVEGKELGEPLFPKRPGFATVQRDFRAAGVPVKDHRGRVVNGHSCRYFFCCLIAGVLPIQRVRQLMRHADIRTTVNLYLDLGIEDLADQLQSLPPLFESAKKAAEKTTQGRAG